MHMKFLFSLPIFFSALFIPAIVFGVGITPELTRVEGMLPNTSIETEIFFSRGDASKAENVEILIEGPMADYIATPHGSFIELPQNEQLTRYPFIISSKDLPVGEYEANIRVKPVPETDSENAAGSALLAGAQGRIQFTVVNEEKALFSISSIDIYDTEENQPPGITFRLLNSGNVAARPSKIELEYFSLTDPTFRAQETIEGDRIDFVSAFTEDDVRVVTNTPLAQGAYIVNIRIFNDAGENISEIKERQLDVFPIGSLDVSGELLSFVSDKSMYTIGEIAEFQAFFQNSSDIGVTASLVIEVFSNGSRVEVIKTDPLFFPAGETSEITATYRVGQAGEYRVEGDVVYGVHTTETKTIEFQVEELSSTTTGILLGGSILFLFILFFGVHRFLQHRRAKNEKKGE